MGKITPQELALRNKIEYVYNELNKLFPEIEDIYHKLFYYCNAKNGNSFNPSQCIECAFLNRGCGTIDAIYEHLAYVLKDTRG